MLRAYVCLGVALLVTVGPQSPTGSSQADASVNASLTVRLCTGAATYRIGEEIPLDLEFLGTAERDYFLKTATSEFRSSDEQFDVTPHDGAVDPLVGVPGLDRLGASVVGGRKALDGRPFELHVTLNDWVRFTRPGHYQLIVTSHRLARDSGEAAPVLVSAPVELTIAPQDAPWTAAAVAGAAAAMTQGNPADVVREAALMSYLGTDAATKLEVDHYEAIAAADDEAGRRLLMAPHRAVVVRQMETRVDAGDPLDATYLTTLTTLRGLVDNAGTATPGTPGPAAIRSSYDTRWHTALLRRPLTPPTLAAEFTQLTGGASPGLRQLINQDLSSHATDAVTAFGTLATHIQAGLLRLMAAQPSLTGPWVLPTLRQAYAGDHADVPGGSPDEERVFNVSQPALDLIYTLAPDEGRQLILDEIRTGTHHIGYDSLAKLPDASLADVDPALEDRYAAPVTSDPDALRVRNTTAWLIARYASPGLESFVTDQLTHRRPPCGEEGALLAYLLKHDAPEALKHLGPNPDWSGGCLDSLPDLSARYWDAQLESAAIVQLKSADDMGRVEDAATVLAAHGSIAARPVLVERFAKWSAAARSLDTEWHSTRLGHPLRTIEATFVTALFQYTLSPQDLADIRASCVTDACRARVDAKAGGRP